MDRLKFDIQDENFNAYFEKVSENMSAEQKAQLPQELQHKLFIKRGVYNMKSTKRIGFLGKIFILFAAMKKRVFVIIEDDNGMDIQTFRKYKSNARGNNEYTMTEAGKMIMHCAFVLGSPELMNSIGHLNGISSSPAYNYLIGAKNHLTRVGQFSAERDYINRFLNCYESNKKRWIKEFGVSMSDFLILTYLYDGREVQASYLHNSAFKSAYQGAGSKIRTALSSLRIRGLIIRRGEGKESRTLITIEGKLVVDKILNKYVLIC